MSLTSEVCAVCRGERAVLAIIDGVEKFVPCEVCQPVAPPTE